MNRTSMTAAGLGLLMSLVVATPAMAANVTECGQLDPALANSAPGETITVAEGLHCYGDHDLPDHQITLEGAGSGATLDGEEEVRILEGHDVQGTIIRNLTFVNGNAQGFFNPEGPSDNGDGGAILVDGESPITVESSKFFNNVAQFSGGAIAALGHSEDGLPVVLRGNTFGSSEAGDGNRARSGGAVAVYGDALEASDNTLTSNSVGFDDDGGFTLDGDGGGLLAVVYDLELDGNTFEGNGAGHQGGGAAASVCGPSDVTDNVFEGNAIESTSDLRDAAGRLFTYSGAAGGGLYLEQACPQIGLQRRVAPPDPEEFGLAQSGNRFTENTISSRYFDASGGGQFVSEYDVLSTDDRYHGNSVTIPDERYEDVEGGGLAAQLDEGGHVYARNLVATANTLVTNTSDANSEGGGVYVGSEGGGVLTLVNATIAENSAHDGSGIAGDSNDALELFNSIVHGNHTGDGEGSEIDGFVNFDEANILPGEGRDIRYSVVCTPGGTVLDDGEGNVCVDPKLVDPANGDVHQTPASPTLEAASNDLLDGLTTDYEGDGRSLDADGKNGAQVDMGADEHPAFVTPPPPPPPPPPPAAAAAPQGAVLGTSAKSCVSRRSFRIRLRNRGQKVVKATVFVNGKRVRVLRGKRLTSFVNLRGLPKGRFSVRIELKLANGTTLKGTRRYHTCVPPRPHGVPRV